ncbi:MAG: protein translocase subunit [Alyxoria varia]|nr:MAG: protein translocase subunit [Alyxoria varia]
MADGTSIDAIKQQLQQEAALSNTRTLVTNINQSCYEKCVPNPGGSLSSSEEKCFSNCAEKFKNAWNAVGKAYVERLQQQQRQGGTMFGG